MNDTTAAEVVDLIVKDDAKAKAANAIYDEIAEWCSHQNKWHVRLWNWLRPWHEPVAPHLPMVPKYWRLMVMIRKPEEVTEQGIVLMRGTTEIEELLTYVGMVVAIGGLAFKAKTRAGLKLSKERNARLGDQVVFYKNAGTRFATKDGLQFVIITDTEIWGVTKEPDRLDALAL